MLLPADCGEGGVALCLCHILCGLVHPLDGFLQTDEVSGAVKCGYSELFHHLPGLSGAGGKIHEDGIQSISCLGAFDTPVGQNTERCAGLLNRHPEIFEGAAHADVSLHQHLCCLVRFVVGLCGHIEVFGQVLDPQSEGAHAVRYKIGAAGQIHLCCLREPEDGFQTGDGIIHTPSGEAHVAEGIGAFGGRFGRCLSHLQSRRPEGIVLFPRGAGDGGGIGHCLFKLSVCTDRVRDKLSDLQSAPGGGCYRRRLFRYSAEVCQLALCFSDGAVERGGHLTGDFDCELVFFTFCACHSLLSPPF